MFRVEAHPKRIRSGLTQRLLFAPAIFAHVLRARIQFVRAAVRAMWSNQGPSRSAPSAVASLAGWLVDFRLFQVYSSRGRPSIARVSIRRSESDGSMLCVLKTCISQ